MDDAINSIGPTRPSWAFVLEVIFFMALPWLIVYGMSFLVWTSYYYLAPIFFPLRTYPYEFGMEARTIFHWDQYGLIVDIVYSASIGFAVAYISNLLRKPSFWKVAATYLTVAGAAAGLSHGFAFLMSYEFFMDMP